MCILFNLFLERHMGPLSLVLFCSLLRIHIFLALDSKLPDCFCIEAGRKNISFVPFNDPFSAFCCLIAVCLFFPLFLATFSSCHLYPLAPRISSYESSPSLSLSYFFHIQAFFPLCFPANTPLRTTNIQHDRPTLKLSCFSLSPTHIRLRMHNSTERRKKAGREERKNANPKKKIHKERKALSLKSNQ